MDYIKTSFAALKAAPDFEAIRGTCPETGIENRILSCTAFGAAWKREIHRIDWASGDYHVFAQSTAPIPRPAELTYVED